MEEGLATLAKKQEAEDALKTEQGTILKEKIGDTAPVKALLEKLYQDMIRDKFDDLNTTLDSIKNSLASVNDENLKSMLTTIEAGIKDKEVSKYNASSKMVRELKELL